MNRQRLILFVLVIIFGIAALWSYSAMPRPKTVSTLTYKSGQPAGRPAGTANKMVIDKDDGSKLQLDLLDKEPAAFKGYRRNIFAPIFVDETKIARQQAVAIKPPVQKILPPQTAKVEPVLIKPEPSPLARFTFLGFLKKGSIKTIFLANDKDILLVKKGDKVAGSYEATEISDQALTLTQIETGQEIIIPLLENKPLATAK